MARNKIGMLYSADANVGIFARDVDMLERLVKVKAEYGYPQKFRGAYAKNSNDRVFQVSKLLNDAGMSKGTTLSFQSMDEHTLEVIKRKNIKVTDFKNLMGRYRNAGIPTYSEMICGLPGETYDSWADGFDKLFTAAPDASISCYSCTVLRRSRRRCCFFTRARQPILTPSSTRSSRRPVHCPQPIGSRASSTHGSVKQPTALG